MEFGSDFHKIEYPVGKGLPYGIFNHYVSGRQPLLDLIETYGYNRIWIPSYYCGESIQILNRTNVEVQRYNCLPTENPDTCIENLPLEPKDLLMRVNFFGLHDFHDSSKYPCDIIEDHTHDLIGDWAVNSNARWCFASIRKSIPTADGGVLWSPGIESLPVQPTLITDVSDIIALRYNAMAIKSDYLHGNLIDKQVFLKDFRHTEDRFEEFPLSDCSQTTYDMLCSFDVRKWYDLKKANYLKLLSYLEFNHSHPVHGASDKSTPFSLIILYEDNARRDAAKNYLIKNNVYPAILWPDVWQSDSVAVDFSERMLSIHCDGRYSEQDMILLANILNQVI